MLNCTHKIVINCLQSRGVDAVAIRISFDDYCKWLNKGSSAKFVGTGRFSEFAELVI